MQIFVLRYLRGFGCRMMCLLTLLVFFLNISELNQMTLQKGFNL